MLQAILKNRIKLATWCQIIAYFLFFLTLLTNNAVLLIFLLPVAFLFLIGGAFLWLACVVEEAKEKELL